MNAFMLRVGLSVDSAAQRVRDYVVGHAISAELVDDYAVRCQTGQVRVLVFEKYFMRNSSRASLTVTIDDQAGYTRVRSVGSGGGQGTFLRFDWGAANSFAASAERALSEFIMP